MRSARPGSCGGIRSTTGPLCGGRAIAGGSSACGGRPVSSTSPGSITSAASSPTGRCPRARATPTPAAGGEGPAPRSFDAARRELGALPLIAEDLGIITPPVARLRRELGLPGHGRAAVRLRRRARQPEPAREPRRELWSSTPARTTRTPPAAGGTRWRPKARAATGLDPAEPHWSLLELALSSPAALAILPAQDVLGLGSEARMNRPGIADRQLELAARARVRSPAGWRRVCAATPSAAGGSRTSPAAPGARPRSTSDCPVSSSVLRPLSTPIQPSPETLGGGLRGVLELVVHDREQADAAVARLDLPGHPAACLHGQLGVVQRLPAVHEPARRVELVHRRVAPDLVVGAERVGSRRA